MRSLSFLAVLGLLAALTASSNTQAEPGDQGWGTVKGRVVWGGGALPERKPIAKVNDNQDKAHCLAKGPLLEEDWVVNPANKGIRWTFVWLAPEPNGPKLPVHPSLQAIKEKEVAVDQPNCQFVPHAVGLRQGQVLVAKNSAPVAHNVNWTGGLKNPGNNVILPAGKDQQIKDLVADKYPIQLKCNIHPWMTGWVRVFDHPYFAVTDADGKFEFKEAPAGKFRLVVWHESVGFLGGKEGRDGRPLEIKPGGDTDVGNLELKPQ